MVAFFLSVSAFFFFLTIFPFVIYPLTLRIIRKFYYTPLIKEGVQTQTSYALCVCAYNEEAVIEDKIKNILQIKKLIPSLEVLFYVDAASDRTAEILMSYANEFFVHVSDERHGKTYGMNMLVAESKADIIVFSDANVMLDAPSLLNLEKYFSDTNIGCVCGNLIYVNKESTETSENGSLYWRLEEWIKQLECETGSLMGADGSIFAIRRELHVPPPDNMIDDMFVSFSILCNGHRIVRAQDVIAYEESVTIAKEEFRRKVRIACQALNVHRLLWPQLQTLPKLELYKYISHKLVRWFTIYWISLSVVSFELALLAANLTYIALILFVGSTTIILAGVRMKLPLITQVVDILYAFLGVGVGVWQSYVGEKYQTWTPATSIRKSS